MKKKVINIAKKNIRHALVYYAGAVGQESSCVFRIMRAEAIHDARFFGVSLPRSFRKRFGE